jgi:hypothetical protein
MEHNTGTKIDRSCIAVVNILAKHALLIQEKGNCFVEYELDGVDLDVLHAVVCLGVESAGFEDLPPQAKEAIKRFRGFCKRVWMGQGLTPDEAETIDTMRVEIRQGGSES